MTQARMILTVVGLMATMLPGCTTTMEAEGMQLADLKQPPLNTTMMGVLKGVADYHGLELTEPEIYGLSGHAFLINIHVELCPSGPYCWKRENAEPLIENMGMRMTDLGFFETGAKPEARADVERKLRNALDKGIPCSLINMENQIIHGYDDTGFFSAQPWAPKMKFPPGRLSFGSWKEFGDEIHVNFYTIEKVEPTDRRAAILASLDYAIDTWKNPSNHSLKAFGVGPKAYDNWIAAAAKRGSSHGNWWNATVWSECRRMAADYVAAIGKDNKAAAKLCDQIAKEYRTIAESLASASDKTMDPGKKVQLLRETKQREADAIGKLEKLAETLRSQKAQ
jgi:hypothetical protein